MRDILITGGAGFVGSRLAQYYKQDEPIVLTKPQLDIGDRIAVETFLKQEQPKLILHTAALSNTGYCQAHPEESFRVNVEGTENMALAAEKIGAKLIVFSSDQVYSDSIADEPHLEDEPVEPCRIYGKHKREAEQRAMEACPNTICLRASWMYDLPVKGIKTNIGLPGAIMRAAIEGETLGLSSNEKRGVTWVELLIRQMDLIAELPSGIYNAGAENCFNSFETGLAFANIIGISKDIVKKVEHPARNLAMNCQKLRSQGVELGQTIEGLKGCLKAYNIL